jgi:hypothetical protein
MTALMSRTLGPPRGPDTFAPVVQDATMSWNIELDRLELDVMRAERALPQGDPVRTDSWNPPAVIGPIPPALVERALGLLARQEACLEEMDRRRQPGHRQPPLSARLRRRGGLRRRPHDSFPSLRSPQSVSRAVGTACVPVNPRSSWTAGSRGGQVRRRRSTVVVAPVGLVQWWTPGSLVS